MVIGSRTRKSTDGGRSRSRGRYGRAFAVGAVISGASLFAAPAFAATTGAHQAALGSGNGGSLDVSAIAAKVDPGVVDINTTLDNGAAAGTGMVLTSDGVVLTNNHVINGATSVNVQVAGSGPSYTAKVLGYDASDDVALLKIDGASGLDTVSTADSSQVQVNDPVVALGNALGRGGTPATAQGSVTGVNQTITAADDNGGNPETLTGMIQIDAAIQPGDSGGPLANADGKVIGMDSAGSSNGSQFGGGSSATEGFAIPINHALDIAKQISDGDASAKVHIGPRAILGIEIGSTSAPSGNTGGSSGGVGGSDPFGNSGPLGGFGGNDPFGNSSSANNDPFGNSSSANNDPFGNSSSANNDPFGNSNSGSNDPFGNSNSGSNDPFGNAGSGSRGNSGSSVGTSGDGVQIAGVASGSPAESAGLAAGDTITSVDGHSVSSPDDISSAMNSHRPGDKVEVQWTDSSGQQHTATIGLVEGPPA